MNAYARLLDLKVEVQGGGSKNSNDPVLARLAERASRIADDHCRRHFYSRSTTRYVDTKGENRLWFPFDVVSITTLKVDEDGDGVYEKTLTANTDYWLIAQRGDESPPYIGVQINPRSSTLSRFPDAFRAVQLVGVIGHDNETVSTGLTGTLSSSSDTTLIASADASTLISVGDTLVIESEQIDVTAVTGTTVEVGRGINGTTAASHTTAAISRRVYPQPVVEAVTMLVARTFREAQTGFSGSVGPPDIGYSFRSMYPAIRDALAPYVAHQAAR